MVVAVSLVEVHVVHSQAREGTVDALHDVLARQAHVVGALRADGPVDLGEDLQGLAAPAGQCPPQNLLGGRVGVDVRGVEARDSQVQGRVNALDGGIRLHLGAVSEPVAVGDLGDFQS
jgi:hypothetical protein